MASNKRNYTVNATTETMLQAVAVLATLKGRDYPRLTGEGLEWGSVKNGGYTIEVNETQNGKTKSGKPRINREFRLVQMANGKMKPVVPNTEFGSKAEVQAQILALIAGIELGGEKAVRVNKELFVETTETEHTVTQGKGKGEKRTLRSSTLAGDYKIPDISPEQVEQPQAKATESSNLETEKELEAA